MGVSVDKARAFVYGNGTLWERALFGWLFMAYHAVDYFLNVTDFPDLAAYREATLANVRACAEAAPEKQSHVLFQFVPAPESVVAKALPDDLIAPRLAHLAGARRADGGWDDEHGLPQWRPYITIVCLLALKNYGRL